MSQQLLTTPSTSITRVYSFGPFLLDPRNHILFRNGQRVPLPPKALDLLLVLVENRANVLTKDALMTELWPDCFVEEANLTQQIAVLRKALGFGAGTQYIETLPRRGYRFVAACRLYRA